MRLASLLLVFVLLLIGCQQQPKLKPLQEGDVIVAFGDSLTYGTGAKAGASYPAVLQSLIGYYVVNAGVPGEETEHALKRLDAVLDANNPALVIVCLGGNDLLRRRPYETIKQNLKNIVTNIQKRGVQVIILAVPEPNLRMRIPTFYPEVGKELSVPVEEATLAKLMANPDFKSDYIHLNNQGYGVLAAEIAEFLQNAGAIKHINKPRP